MNRKIFAKNVWLVLSLSLIFTLSSTNAFARGRESRPHREVVVVGHERYHYRYGRFYRPWFFGFEFAVAAPPIGAIVTFLPASRRSIISGGITYYYYDNIYYRACPSGYLVVTEPVINSNVTYAPPAAQYAMPSGQTVTINVPNSNGSYTPITLVKHNNGYIGPQGEYYSGNPTIDQLKALYGK